MFWIRFSALDFTPVFTHPDALPVVAFCWRSWTCRCFLVAWIIALKNICDKSFSMKRNCQLFLLCATQIYCCTFLCTAMFAFSFWMYDTSWMQTARSQSRQRTSSTIAKLAISLSSSSSLGTEKKSVPQKNGRKRGRENGARNLGTAHKVGVQLLS